MIHTRFPDRGLYAITDGPRDDLRQVVAQALARRVAPLGWHIQIYADGDKMLAIAPLLARLPVQVVIDHCGGVMAALGTRHPQFQALLRLMDSGRAWMKVCGYRVSSAGAPSKWPVIPFYQDPFPRTGPVPVSAPNERGIYDLGGNVWQWCQDSFGKSNPRWGVLRGGSWATSRPDEMLSSFRKDLDPNFREDNVGFRCVIASDAGLR